MQRGPQISVQGSEGSPRAGGVSFTSRGMNNSMTVGAGYANGLSFMGKSTLFSRVAISPNTTMGADKKSANLLGKNSQQADMET